jgi:hypothetical protein
MSHGVVSDFTPLKPAAQVGMYARFRRVRRDITPPATLGCAARSRQTVQRGEQRHAGADEE